MMYTVFSFLKIYILYFFCNKIDTINIDDHLTFYVIKEFEQQIPKHYF